MSDEALHRLRRLAFMKLTREFDQRFEKLLLTGRVAKWYSEIGNEATTVPAGLALEPGDVLCSLHRDLGAILAVYLDPARAFPELGFGATDGLRPEPEDLLYRLACQLLGRGDGFSQGIERSFHYGYLDPSAGIRHLGMVSHLGAMIPVAAGCAFALRHGETDRVALNFIGDGGTSTGDFHEGLNMAAVWKLPLILVVENNRFAYSTPTSQQYAAKRLSDRGAGYGIPAETVDGNDPEAVAASMDRAIRRARAGDGPTLIEAMLGRMRGHSDGDDSLKVVPPADLEAYRAADPVPAYERTMRRAGQLAGDLERRLGERVTDLVETAIDAALDADPPKSDVARRSVFAPVPEPSIAAASGTSERASARFLSSADPSAGSSYSRDFPAQGVSYIGAIHRALEGEMERDDSMVLMGQDIGRFEGAFRATLGLHERWPHRVLDTPIAESGTLGIAIGAAILGFRPVVEMQFADFIACGFNQVVNVAAKLFYRWQVPCPLVVRLPSGGGVVAGPFHSQNPEAWFAHVAGLKVVCPATAADAHGLLLAAIRDPNPVMFLEHKYLYRRIKEDLAGRSDTFELGKAATRRQGRDLTLIGYGASVWTCFEAATLLEQEGVEAEVVDLRTLVPFDESAVVDSVRKTSRALIVHEAQRTGGFGGEIAARITDAAFPWLDAPVRRVAYPDRPVPYVSALERELLPSVERVVSAARELLAF